MTTVKQYGAHWCNPCKALTPIMQQIAEQNPTINYQYIDVDHNPDEAREQGIRSVPTVVIIKDGVETNRIIGLQPRAVYEQSIK